ncbi:MAG: DUF4214 domain-containing protein [Rhodocyclaceae bacterium]|nr:DUF4214 domain-containing protein [Rhodocyclaceae bacterium]
MQSSTQITQLYVALFNRAPDPEGLRFWAQMLEGGTPIDRIIEQMFATAPAREFYPEGLSGQEIVAQFYRNALGREPDAEGLEYWTQQMNTRDLGEVLNTIVYVVTHYDGNHPDGLASAALFGNKAALAEAYTAALDAAGLTDTNDAALNVTQSILAAVTSSSDVNTLIAEIVDKAVALTAVALEKPEIVAAIIPTGGKLSDLMDAMPAGSTFADLFAFAEKLAGSADSAAAIEALIPEGGSSLADFLEKLPAGTTPESLVESAAQGPGGLENIGSGSSSGGGSVSPPPPPPPPPTTFTVTETAGVLAFGGSASGAITVSESGGVLSFTRGGVAAATTVAIDSLADDTGIPADPGVTMAEAVFAAVKAKLADGAATIGGAVSAEQAAVTSHHARIKAGGVTAITYADEDAFAAAADAVNSDAVAADAITLSAGAVTATSQALVLGNIAKFKAGQITGIAFADDAALQAAAAQVADDAIGSGAITLTDGAVTTAKAAVLGNVGKFADDAVTGIALTGAEFATAGLTAKLADGAASVDADGATAGELGALAAGIGKAEAGGITGLTLTNAQTATEIEILLGKATGAAVVATGMDGDKLAKVAGAIGSVAAGGITGLTLTNAQSETEIEILLGKATGAAVDATGMDGDKLAKVAGGIGSVAAGGITGLALTDAQTGTEIENLLGKATGAAVDATDMNAAKLNKVAGAIDGVADDGITGALMIDAGLVSGASVASLLGKYGGDSAALVEGGSLSSEPAKIAVVEAVIAGKFADGGLSNMTLTPTLFATITGDGIARMDAAANWLTVNGGEGDDTIDGTGYTKTLNLHGNNGNDTITGGDGDDHIYGGDGDDVIHGGAGDDRIAGGAGSDTLYGDDGDDTIYGSDYGGSTVDGGNGDDTIYCSRGGNTLTGGAGDDLFVVDGWNFGATSAAELASAANIITDFGDGADRIQSFGEVLSSASRGDEATAGTAQIVSGVATFDAGDATLEQKLTAVANAIGSGGWGKAAVFLHEGDSYLFISDGNAGISNGDALVKLVGIAATALILDGSSYYKDITGFA